MLHEMRQPNWKSKREPFLLSWLAIQSLDLSASKQSCGWLDCKMCFLTSYLECQRSTFLDWFSTRAFNCKVQEHFHKCVFIGSTKHWPFWRTAEQSGAYAFECSCPRVSLRLFSVLSPLMSRSRAMALTWWITSRIITLDWMFCISSRLQMNLLLVIADIKFQ